MFRKRTLNAVLLLVLVAATIAVGLTRSARVSGQDDASPAAGQDTETKIASAMSAAPASVADKATILDNAVDADGEFVVLREGSNGWYCLPDAFGTPGPDPWCFDETWLSWTYQFMAGQAPRVAVPGVAYMLQGGSEASNTDPFATGPAAGDEWMASPPHIMILQPGKLDLSVFSTAHDNGGPWVMWGGTPYEHIMVPVADGGEEHAHTRHVRS
jgi:hypothetical protein